MAAPSMSHRSRCTTSALTTNDQVIVVWFRRDLRVDDNPALDAAVKLGATIIPVFVWAPEEEGQFNPGRCCRWWLFKSLRCLDQRLRSLGSRLILCRSPQSSAILLDICAQAGASALFYSHLFDPVSLVRDNQVKHALTAVGVSVETFNADVLFPPWELTDDRGDCFSVFEDFWAKLMTNPAEPEAPHFPPRRLPPVPDHVRGCTLEELELERPEERVTNHTLDSQWRPGELEGTKMMESFLRDKLHTFARDGPAGGSMLSPYLHFGEISVRRLWHNLHQAEWTYYAHCVTEADVAAATAGASLLGGSDTASARACASSSVGRVLTAVPSLAPRKVGERSSSSLSGMDARAVPNDPLPGLKRDNSGGGSVAGGGGGGNHLDKDGADGAPLAPFFENANFVRFKRHLLLREYSRYLSFNFPFTHQRALLEHINAFPWRQDPGMFKSWRQGRTGYPLVDAGMRQLWTSGWCPNHIRVLVASFAVKFLMLPWQWGMKYFWETLLDADLELDVLGWQFVSGCLPDGLPLESVHDPSEEGRRLDPDGSYVRRWIPELSRMPVEWIHVPWAAPPGLLEAAGVELGANYPRPVVEMATVREKVKQAVRLVRKAKKGARLEADKAQADADAAASIKPGGSVELSVDGRPTSPLHNTGGSYSVPRPPLPQQQTAAVPGSSSQISGASVSTVPPPTAINSYGNSYSNNNNNGGNGPYAPSARASQAYPAGRGPSSHAGGSNKPETATNLGAGATTGAGAGASIHDRGVPSRAYQPAIYQPAVAVPPIVMAPSGSGSQTSASDISVCPAEALKLAARMPPPMPSSGGGASERRSWGGASERRSWGESGGGGHATGEGEVAAACGGKGNYYSGTNNSINNNTNRGSPLSPTRGGMVLGGMPRGAPGAPGTPKGGLTDASAFVSSGMGASILVTGVPARGEGKLSAAAGVGGSGQRGLATPKVMGAGAADLGDGGRLPGGVEGEGSCLASDGGVGAGVTGSSMGGGSATEVPVRRPNPSVRSPPPPPPPPPPPVSTGDPSSPIIKRIKLASGQPGTYADNGRGRGGADDAALASRGETMRPEPMGGVVAEPPAGGYRGGRHAMDPQGGENGADVHGGGNGAGTLGMAAHGGDEGAFAAFCSAQELAYGDSNISVPASSTTVGPHDGGGSMASSDKNGADASGEPQKGVDRALGNLS